MVTTRMTLAEIKARGSARDMSRLKATSEAEIRRRMVEDGQDPDAGRPRAQWVRCRRRSGGGWG